MKILKIKIKNLNSLYGEWVLDFTHPSYSLEGLFCVSGATGSGKTTLLDALCLALYGRTPRLDTVGPSSNEIMSRGTYECSAWVEYETFEGRFEAFWHQSRAGKKADGKLQPVKREFSQIFPQKEGPEKKIDVVKNKIEKSMGMDYKQFTRSILLAQNEFSTFLYANVKEKSSILEKITESNIYTRISKKVWELKGKLQKEVGSLREDVEGKNFGEQKEEDFNLKIDFILKKEEELLESLKKHQELFQWKKDFLKYEKELQENQGNIFEIEKKCEEFQENAQKIRRALLAQKCEIIFSQREEAFCQKKKEEENLIDIQKKINSQKDIKEKMDFEEKKIFENLHQEKEKYEKLKFVLERVKEFDSLIREKESLLKKEEENLHKKEKNISKNKEERRSFDEESSNLENQILKIDKYLKKYEKDSSLQEKIPLLQKSQEMLIGSLKKMKGCEKEENELLAILKEKNEELIIEKREKEDLILRKENDEKIYSELKKKEENFKEIFFQKDLYEKKKELSEIKEKLKIKEQYDILEKNIQKNEEEKEIYVKKILSQEQRIKDLSYEIEKLENDLHEEISLQDFYEKVHSLEKLREDLEENKPCPLCGSLYHPFQEGLQEHAQESSLRKEALKDKKKRKDILKKEEEKEKKLEKELLIQNATLENNMKRDQEEKKILETKLGEMKESLFYEKNILFLENEILKIEKQEKDFEEWNKQIKNKKEELEKREKEILKIIKKEEDIYHFISLNKSRKEDIEKRKRDENNFILKESSALKNFFEEYDLTFSLEEEDIVSKFKLLKERNIEYKNKFENRNNIKSQKDQISIKRERTLEEFENLLKDKENMEENKKKYLEELSLLKKERFQIFENKEVRKEEFFMEKNLKEKQEEYENILKRHNEENDKYVKYLSLRDDALKRCKENSEKYKKKDDEFKKVLIQNEFLEENEFLVSRLERNEFISLQKQQEELKNKKENLEFQRKNLVEKFTVLKNENKTSLNMEEIENILKSLEDEKEKYIKEKTVLNMQKKMFLEEFDKYQEKIKLWDKKKEEFYLMEELCSYIGSADGRKFRDFAQNLSFRSLVELSNHELRKMTDRFELVSSQDEEKFLELEVFDAYQNTIRSVKNLSGGETFMVSLALALGLSHMASQKVRVDSLFLDEGFGSLDEDSLEMAMNALSALHQNGKMVGVISHVTSMKERIPLQIQVISQGNGRSVIKGEGVGEV